MIDGPKIVLERIDAICIYALASLHHYFIALREGISPKKLGLSKDEENAHIHCVDHGEPYTKGGTVVFRCQEHKGGNLHLSLCLLAYLSRVWRKARLCYGRESR